MDVEWYSLTLSPPKEAIKPLSKRLAVVPLQPIQNVVCEQVQSSNSLELPSAVDIEIRMLLGERDIQEHNKASQKKTRE